MHCNAKRGMGGSPSCCEAALSVPNYLLFRPQCCRSNGGHIFFATDGVRNDFSESLTARKSQRRPTDLERIKWK